MALSSGDDTFAAQERHAGLEYLRNGDGAAARHNR